MTQTWRFPSGTILLDDEDADLFGYWGIHKGYARRRRKNKDERLHRVVMSRVLGRELLSTELVDHTNHDTLDNRRSNLRIASHSDNSRNRKRRIDAQWGYKGIEKLSGDALTKKLYMARVIVHSQRFYLGTFHTADEAAWMYDQWALELHGEFAYTNFDYV